MVEPYSTNPFRTKYATWWRQEHYPSHPLCDSSTSTSMTVALWGVEEEFKTVY